MKLMVLCQLLSDTKARLRNREWSRATDLYWTFRAHGSRDDLTSHHHRNPDDRL